MSTTSGSTQIQSSLIYVVDDEPMLLELAAAILEGNGHRVQSFRDGPTALEAFAQSEPKPDLVITDYTMLRMNGLELVAECRKLHPAQKVLLLTGTVGPEIFDSSTTKPDAYLAKPYHSAQLAELVTTMLKD